MYNYKRKNVLEGYYDIFQKIGLNKCFLYYEGLSFKNIGPKDLGIVIFYNDDSIETKKLNVEGEQIALKTLLKEDNSEFIKKIETKEDCINFLIGKSKSETTRVRINYLSDRNHLSVLNDFIYVMCKESKINSHIKKNILSFKDGLMNITNLNNSPYNLNLQTITRSDVTKIFINHLAKIDGDLLLNFVESLPDDFSTTSVYIDIFRGIVNNDFNDNDNLNKIAEICINRILTGDRFLKEKVFDEIVNYVNKSNFDWTDDFLKKYSFNKLSKTDIVANTKTVIEVKIDSDLIYDNNKHLNKAGLERFLRDIVSLESKHNSKYIERVTQERFEIDKFLPKYVTNIGFHIKDNVELKKEGIEDYLYNALNKYITEYYKKSENEKKEIADELLNNIDSFLLNNEIDDKLHISIDNKPKRRKL